MVKVFIICTCFGVGQLHAPLMDYNVSNGLSFGLQFHWEWQRLVYLYYHS